MTTIVVNDNTPQTQCPGYVVIGGGAKIKYSGTAVSGTGDSKYGYGWVEGDNSLASFAFTSCTGIITKHDNGRITLAHIAPNGYGSGPLAAYKTWLSDTVGGTLQNMWLVGSKNGQVPSNFNDYRPSGCTIALAYIGPKHKYSKSFASLNVLCTPGVITIRCKPDPYDSWTEGFTTDGAAFNNNFQNANGGVFLGQIKKLTL